MSYDAYKRFSKILKETGAPVEASCFQWMFDDETVPGYKLLHWLADNITSDNYLNVTEQREYQQLLSKGEYLTGEELSESMLEIDKKYPGIWADSEEDCDNDILEQIELLTNQTELVRQCINDLDDLDDSQFEKLRRSDCMLSAELKSVEEDCSHSLKTLQDAENDLEYSMLQIQDHFDHKKSGNVLLNQMDIETLIKTLELNRKHTKLYLERQFSYSQNMEHLTTDLKMLYKRLVEGFQYDLCYEAESEAWKACCRELTHIHSKIHTITDVDREIDSLTAAAIAMEDQIEVSEQEIKSAAEKYALRLIMKAHYQDNEHKLAKRISSQEKLTTIESFLRDRSCTWEILWRMLTIEGDAIEHLQSRYKDVQNMQKVRERNVLLRVYDLNKLLKIQSQEPHLQLNASLCNLSMQLLQCKGIQFKAFGENYSIIDIYNKLVAETNNEIDLYSKKLNSVSDNMKELDNIIKEKNILVFNSICKSPVCISPMHYPIYNCQNNLLELEEQIKSIKDVFKNKKQSLKSSVVLDAQRQLWIYFLCEPKKVLFTLDNVKNMIQSGSKMHRSRP